MWHFFPPASEVEFRAAYFAKTSTDLTSDALANIQCFFHWGNAGFVCIIDDTPDFDMSDYHSPQPKMITYIGNISKSDDIPVSLDGHKIIGGGFQQRGKETRCWISLDNLCERFFVPKSIKDRLLAEARCRSTHSNKDATEYTLDFLAGCRLIRPDEDIIRVTDCANKEIRLWIVNALGEMMILPPETSRSEGARTSKRQRIN
jgi:hypothetical protein